MRWVKWVPQLSRRRAWAGPRAGRRGVRQPGQLRAQPLDLLVVEDPHAGQVAVLLVEGDLRVGQAVTPPTPLRARGRAP